MGAWRKPAGAVILAADYAARVLYPGYLQVLVIRIMLLSTVIILFSDNIRLFKGRYHVLALLASIFTLSIYNSAGLVLGFVQNVYDTSLAGLSYNLVYLLFSASFVELLRYVYTSGFRRGSAYPQIILVSLLLTLPAFTLAQYQRLFTGQLFEFLGSRVLPEAFNGVLLTTLSYLGGFTCSLAYVFMREAFLYATPIVPSLPWQAQALTGTLGPLLGVYLVTQNIRPQALIGKGLAARSDFWPRRTGVGWILTLVAALAIVWGSSGLLGFKPAVILSGSMSPALEVGDIVLVRPVRLEEVAPGEIIHFYSSDSTPTVHRVVQVDKSPEATRVVTKGDANNAPDGPITDLNLASRVFLVVPKLGWVTIMVRTLLHGVGETLQTGVARELLNGLLIGLPVGLLIYKAHILRDAVTLLRRTFL